MKRTRFVLQLGLLLLWVAPTLEARARPYPEYGGRGIASYLFSEDFPFIAWRICSGNLTNINYDHENCGRCSLHCTNESICCEGHCVDTHENCGACGFPCSQQEECCPQTVENGSPPGDFKCVNLATDALN